MGGITDIVIRGYIPFLANIGVLALLAWVVSNKGRELARSVGKPSLKFSLLIGGMFGATAALLMNIPIELEPGIFGDGRAVPILLSGIFGGPVAALVSGALAGAMRISLGGSGMFSGLIYIATFVVASMLTFWVFCRRAGKLPNLLNTLLIATITTGVSSGSVLTFSPESRLAVLTQLWPLLLAANLIGIALLGGMLGREYARRMAEIETLRQRERADNAAQAKSKFLAAMSHEIRTPLNAILGIHQILARTEMSDDVREKIKTAQDSGQFLLALINQVLDFAKIDAGARPVNKAPFSVQAMLNALQSIFFYQASAKGLEFDVTYDGSENDVVVADRNLTQQILFNLIGNAIKFTNDGAVRVQGSVAEVSPGTCTVRVDVMDTGPGISQEDQVRIFEEFEQSVIGQEEGGTGLGLAICNKIAASIGAKLSVLSAPGRGATFTMTLPAPQGELKDCAPAADTVSVMPVTVLVVEDNAINQEIARTMLEQDGHIVQTASNGREAVEILSQDAVLPDIVFMDIQMPILDGVDATKEIRLIHGAESLPIIALSANAFSEQQAEYLEAGMNAALSKPLQLQELRKCVQRYGGKRYIGNVMPTAAGDDEGDFTFVPTVDLTVLDPLISVMGQEQLTGLTDILKTSSANQLSRLRAVKNDPALVGAISHDLKGMYGNFGLVRAARAAERLESDRQDGNEEFLTDELAREVDRAFLELDALVEARMHRKPAAPSDIPTTRAQTET